MKIGITFQPRFYRLRHWGFMHSRQQYMIRWMRDGRTFFLGPLVIFVA